MTTTTAAQPTTDFSHPHEGRSVKELRVLLAEYDTDIARFAALNVRDDGYADAYAAPLHSTLRLRADVLSRLAKHTPDAEFGLTTRPVLVTVPGGSPLTLTQGTAVIVERRGDDPGHVYITRGNHTVHVEAAAVRPLA